MQCIRNKFEKLLYLSENYDVLNFKKQYLKQWLFKKSDNWMMIAWIHWKPPNHYITEIHLVSRMFHSCVGIHHFEFPSFTPKIQLSRLKLKNAISRRVSNSHMKQLKSSLRHTLLLHYPEFPYLPDCWAASALVRK